MHLTFQALRQANIQRLPQFKNALGESAHEKSDGSDWTPAQWLGAVAGELGELARVRLNYEFGFCDRETYERYSEKESADVVTYLDLFALRCLDMRATPGAFCPRSQALLELVAAVGEYANDAKKFDRGDLSEAVFAGRRDKHINAMLLAIHMLGHVRPAAKVEQLAGGGFDLGVATAAKFNEVSRRVGADVFIYDGAVHTKPA